MPEIDDSRSSDRLSERIEHYASELRQCRVLLYSKVHSKVKLWYSEQSLTRRVMNTVVP